MIEATQGRDRGQWWPRSDGSATYYCAKCGNPMSLGGHTVSEDGTLNPSVVCPWVIRKENAIPTAICGCGFHNHIRLVGWLAAAPTPSKQSKEGET